MLALAWGIAEHALVDLIDLIDLAVTVIVGVIADLGRRLIACAARVAESLVDLAVAVVVDAIADL